MTTKEVLNGLGERLHACRTATITHEHDCTCVTCGTVRNLAELYRRVVAEGIQ